MTTTAVFAEILAVGVQALVLIGLGAASFLDIAPAMGSVSGWEAAITLGLVAVAYVLGVVVDRLADTALKPLRERVSSSGAYARRARRRILAEASPLATFLEYQRSRMRLMRGTILNLIIAVPVVNVFLASGTVEPGVRVGINLLLLCLLVACVFAFVEIMRAQDSWLALLSPADQSDAPAVDGS